MMYVLFFCIFIHTKYKRISRSFPVEVDVFVNPQFVAPEDGFQQIFRLLCLGVRLLSVSSPASIPDSLMRGGLLTNDPTLQAHAHSLTDSPQPST